MKNRKITGIVLSFVLWILTAASVFAAADNTRYKVILNPTEHVTATPDKTEVEAFEQVIVHTSVDAGYAIEKVEAATITGAVVEIVPTEGEGNYTFQMPQADVIVTITEKKEEADTTEDLPENKDPEEDPGEDSEEDPEETPGVLVMQGIPGHTYHIYAEDVIGALKKGDLYAAYTIDETGTATDEKILPGTYRIIDEKDIEDPKDSEEKEDKAPDPADGEGMPPEEEKNSETENTGEEKEPETENASEPDGEEEPGEEERSGGEDLPYGQSLLGQGLMESQEEKEEKFGWLVTINANMRTDVVLYQDMGVFHITSYDQEGEEKTGQTYHVKRITSSLTEEPYEANLAAQGEMAISPLLPYGTYEITDMDGKTQQAELDASICPVIFDIRSESKIMTVIVQDQTEDVTIAGMALTLETKEGEVLGTYTSNSAGIFSVPNTLQEEAYLSLASVPGYGKAERVKVDADSETVKIPVTRVEGFFSVTVKAQGAAANTVVEVYTDADIRTPAGTLLYYKDMLITTITTDEKGKGVTPNLPLGKYRLKAVTEIPGVERPKEKEVSLTYADDKTLVVEKEEVIIYGTDQLMVVVKEKGNDTILTDTSVEVWADGASRKTYNADENGIILIENVTGRVNIKQKRTKEGYLLSKETYKYEIDPEEPAEYVIENGYTRIQVDTVDKDKPLDQVVVSILDAKGNQVVGWNTNQGSGEAEKLAAGKYKIVIKEVPAGYILPKEKEITVKETEELQKFKIEIKRRELQILIQDKEDGSFLKNGRFQIEDESGNLVTEMDCTGAEIALKELQAGTYKATMITTPRGYVRAETVEFTVNDTEEKQAIEMKCERVKGYINVTTVTTVYQEPVAGAVFELKDPSGKVIETLTTDGDGLVQSDTYEIGTYKDGEYVGPISYRFSQKSAPVNYTPTKSVLTVQFEYLGADVPLVYQDIKIPNKLKDEGVTRTIKNGTAGGSGTSGAAGGQTSKAMDAKTDQSVFVAGAKTGDAGTPWYVYVVSVLAIAGLISGASYYALIHKKKQ